MEKTLVLLKPSAVQRGLIGEVLKRFEQRGLRLVGMKMMQLTDELLDEHYVHLSGKPFFKLLKDSMMVTPIIACCFEGKEAVSVVRAMAGATNGRQALPGTIRGDYCVSNQQNIVHTSDSLENATVELARFFKPEEIFEYHSSAWDMLYAADEI